MIGPSGNYAMLATSTLPPDAEPGSLLVFGSEPEVRALAAKVRLGHREQEARAARRKRQRESRRRNR